MKHEGSRPPADSSVLVHAVADTEAMQSPAGVGWGVGVWATVGVRDVGLVRVG